MAIISKKNQKLGKVWNISLAPAATCGDVPCKKQCYAMKAYRMYEATKKAWDSNTEEVKADSDAFFADIGQQLRKARKKPELFRFHVAGDIPTMGYFMRMILLAREFPEIKFLAFTKQHAAVNYVIDFLGKPLPVNLSIVFSAWPGMEMDNPYKLPVAWMQDGTETRIPPDAINCFSRCDTCGICWNLTKLGKDVVFTAH